MSAADSLHYESVMTNMKERLVLLVKVDDLSSVQMMSSDLGISEEEVRIFLTELTQEGTLNGYLSEDGERYFKRDVKVSEAPVIHREEDVPDFLKFDTRPGRIAAIFGLALAAIGVFGLVNSGDDLQMENFSAVLTLIGAVVTMAGLFYLTMRKTPA